MSNEQIYHTLKALSQGQSFQTIPGTVLAELQAYGYVKIIEIEEEGPPIDVLITDSGYAFIREF